MKAREKKAEEKEEKAAEKSKTSKKDRKSDEPVFDGDFLGDFWVVRYGKGRTHMEDGEWLEGAGWGQDGATGRRAWQGSCVLLAGRTRGWPEGD